MNVCKTAAKIAAGAALTAVLAFPAFAQSSVNVTRIQHGNTVNVQRTITRANGSTVTVDTVRHRHPLRGYGVTRRTVYTPYGTRTTVIRRHMRRYHRHDLYMTPDGTTRYYSNGHWYYR